jgi:DNA-directed RNA polymerase omega subunit
MSSKPETRSPQVNTEQCVANIGNRFDLVLVASQRLRELKKIAKEKGDMVSTIDALLDIQVGLIKPLEYLRKVR